MAKNTNDEESDQLERTLGLPAGFKRFFSFSPAQLRKLGNIAARSTLMKELRRQDAALLVAASFGDDQLVEFHRYLPIRVYLDADPGQHKRDDLVDAMWSLARALGYDQFADEHPDQHSSWYKAFLMRTGEFFRRREVQDRMQQVEHGLKHALLRLPQTEADEKLATAFGKIAEAIADTDEAAIQIGSLLVVKRTGLDGRSKMFVQTLTIAQLVLLEQQPSILKSPLVFDLLCLTPSEPLAHDPATTGSAERPVTKGF